MLVISTIQRADLMIQIVHIKLPFNWCFYCITDKKEELRKAVDAKKRKQLQFLKSQMETDLKVGNYSRTSMTQTPLEP